MKFGLILGIFCAVLLHLGILLFGGLIFHSDKPNHGTLQQVELLDATEDKKEKLEDPEPEKKELEADAEQAPDAAEIIRNLEKPQAIDAPALEAASLSAIEQALNGSGGGGDFSEALSFSSGGRIGGTGAALARRF